MLLHSLALVRVDATFLRVLAAPRGAVERFPDGVMQAVRMVATTLFQSVDDPKTFDKMIGPTAFIKLFFETWALQLPGRGLIAKVTTPEAVHFATQSAFASLATIPTLSSAPCPCAIAQALTDEDAEAVAPHAVEFTNRLGMWSTTLEEATASMRVATRMGQLWLCHVEGQLAGYVLTGRATPNTVAYRNVYVAPEFRRRGIAEAMVTRITRWFLGAEPSGLEDHGVPPRKEGWRPKEVCLNVVEESVARIYSRCGFLLREEDRDPETGSRATFHMLELRPKYSEISEV